MSEPKVSVILEDWRGHMRGDTAPKPFRVNKVKNSLDFTVGEFLTVNTVKDMIDYLKIDVTIIDKKPLKLS